MAEKKATNSAASTLAIVNYVLVLPTKILVLALLAPGVALADFNVVQVHVARPTCSDPGGKDAACPERGVVLQRMSAGQTDVQLFAQLGFREVDASALGHETFTFFDFGVGARWFPRAATFWLGPRIPVRATLAGSAGMGIGNADDADYPVDVSAGLAVSGLNPRGVMLEAFYRVTRNTAMKLPKRDFLDFEKRHVTAEPHAGIRAAVFF